MINYTFLKEVFMSTFLLSYFSTFYLLLFSVFYPKAHLILIFFCIFAQLKMMEYDCTKQQFDKSD